MKEAGESIKQNHENRTEDASALYVSDISVYASGQFIVELCKGKKVASTNRVPVMASVNTETGEVKFYVDTKMIGRLTE